MASDKELHAERMAAAIQLQSEFGKGQQNGAKKRPSGNKGNYKPTAVHTQAKRGESYSQMSTQMPTGQYGQIMYPMSVGPHGRVAFQMQPTYVQAGYKPNHGNTAYYPTSQPNMNDVDKEVQDFFAPEHTNDVRPGRVVFYQDEYKPGYNEDIDMKIDSVPTTPTKPNAFMGVDNSGGMHDMANDPKVVNDFFRPSQSNAASPTAQPDFYQDNYKKRYEDEKEQRKQFLANTDHARGMTASRHAYKPAQSGNSR